MATIAELMVKIGGDISGLTKSLSDAQSSLSNVGKKMSDVGKTATLSLTLPIVGVGAAIVKTGADFEAAMSGVTSLMSPAEKQAEKTSGAMHDLALKMGAETSFGAVDAAKGIEELIKAGVSMDAIMSGGLKGALDLAVAGELDLASAAEIASTALNSFSKDGLNVEQAANILAGAANASATSVSELKFGLSAVSAVAAATGQTFEGTTTALAVLAQNGLKGSDAGTSLKTMLMNLQPTTKAARNAMRDLGIVTADGTNKFINADGSFKSMAEISGVLKSSMSGLTEAQRLQSMETIFGSDAIRAANILYKEGEDGVNKMNAAMSNTTAADVAKEKLNNLKGSFEQLKGSLETLAVKLFETNGGPLKGLVDVLGQAVDWFSKLTPNMQQTILIVAGVAAAIGPLLMVMGGLTSGIAAVGAALTFLSANPIVLIIAGIVALIAVIVLIVKNWDTVKTKTLEIWGTISSYLSGVWTGLKTSVTTAFENVKTTISEKWSKIKDDVSDWWGKIEAFLRDWWFTILIGVVTGGMGILIPLIIENWTSIRDKAKEWWGLIKDGISEKFQAAVDWIKTTVEAVPETMRSAWETAKTKTSQVWDSLKLVVSKAIEKIKEWVDELPGKMSSTWDSILEYLGNLPSKMVAAGKAIMNGLVDGIKSIKIPMPQIKIDTVEGPMGIKIPKFDFGVNWKALSDFIPFLAEGGITNGPTLAMIGEGREREVVTPLSKLQSMINGGGGGGHTFNIYDARDPNAVAKAVERVLAKSFRSRGVVT